MPTLTGTIVDVTGQDISANQIYRITVKADDTRISDTAGGLVSTRAITLPSTPDIEINLEPGMAVLTVVAAGFNISARLQVADGMTTLREALKL